MRESSTSKLLFQLLLVLAMAVAVLPCVCTRVCPPFASYQKPLHPNQLVAASLRSMLPPPTPTRNLGKNWGGFPSSPPPPTPPTSS